MLIGLVEMTYFHRFFRTIDGVLDGVLAAVLNMQAQYTHVSAVGFTSIGSGPVCDVTDVQRSLSNTLTSKPGSLGTN